MTGLDDLKQAVVDLQTTVAGIKGVVSSLKDQIASLNATIAAGGDNDVDVEAQAKAIEASIADLNAVVNPAPVA